MSTVTNPANDIRKQAHQGSVAAIIQVLNQELSDVGVRTRAVYDGGVLQLLCEGDTPDQLDQTTLPDRVKVILENLAPRGVRRVNINSRIVREQQLLWLDEISREPDKLLWYQEINLVRPNFIKTMMEDVQDSLSSRSEPIGGLSPRQQREKQQFWRGILGGIGATTALILLSWGIFSLTQQKNADTANNASNSNTSNSNTSSSANSSGAKPSTQPAQAQPAQAQKPVDPAKPADGDPFGNAVRLAEESAALGSKAQSPSDWQTIADKWGKASELMAQVPQSDKNYATAQDRTTRYKNNQTAALTKAK
jgi:hypothetical protein